MSSAPHSAAPKSTARNSDGPSSSPPADSSSDLLAHQLRGDADETVLLLNGGMMTHAAWEPVASALLGPYAVLGCDLRGQLLSPGPGHRRLEEHVPDLVRLLDALGLDAPHVIGTSFGAEIGVLLASAHPERVKTLALVTAGDRTPPGMADDSRELRRLASVAGGSGPAEPFRDRLVERVYSDEYRKSHAAELEARKDIALPASWYEGLEGILQSVEDFDLTGHLSRIRCPTLVVHAARDGVFPEERVRALADGIEGAEWRVHPTSGHALVAEDPAWLAETYREFLSRHDRRPRGRER